MRTISKSTSQVEEIRGMNQELVIVQDTVKLLKLEERDKMNIFILLKIIKKYVYLSSC